jgi:uncharacterized RDD family membrane protein YckC
MTMKCPRCGLINPETALRCDCGWDFGTGTAKESYLGKEATLKGELASLSDRFVGQFLDSFFAIAVIIAGVIFSTFSDTLSRIITLGGFAFALLYILFADGLSGGQSYGKRVMKTAVIDATSGQPCAFLKSFIRNILLSFLGVIDWIFIFGRKRQRLGDMAANTIVIKRRNR